MTANGVRRLRAWGGWALTLGLLAGVTAFCVAYRPFFGGRQAPVALLYLLLVLLGSVAGGRTLGLLTACIGSFVLDYYFQLPYGKVAVDDPIDWVVIISYIVAADGASRLIEREQRRRVEAQRRAAEVQRLADLGAETLAAGRADEALQAIANVIARTLHVDRCEVWDVTSAGRPHLAAQAPNVPNDSPPDGRPSSHDDPAVAAALARLAAEAPARSAEGRARSLGTILAASPRDALVPLHAHTRLVGALRLVRADGAGLALDESERTFLEALAHYAALGVERVRLVADAERAEALREADRMKDFVVASVSHDLRTPLTTIKALAHASARAGDRNASVIEEQADRLTRMVTDLLDLSRARAGALPITREINTAEDVVGAALRQVSGVLGARAVETRLLHDGGPLVGSFDFVATLRILGNLLQNAVKYAPGPAPIALEVVREGDELSFVVRDHGPGVSDEERDRIFRPFHRAAGSAPDVGSAGLGLALARALAEAQGGSLTYTPAPGGGSAFTLRVPASTDAHALQLAAADAGEGA